MQLRLCSGRNWDLPPSEFYFVHSGGYRRDIFMLVRLAVISSLLRFKWRWRWGIIGTMPRRTGEQEVLWLAGCLEVPQGGCCAVGLRGNAGIKGFWFSCSLASSDADIAVAQAMSWHHNQWPSKKKDRLRQCRVPDAAEIRCWHRLRWLQMLLWHAQHALRCAAVK